MFYQKLQNFLKLQNVNGYKQLQRKGEKQLTQKKVWKQIKIQSLFCPLIMVQKKIKGAKCNVMLVCIVYIVKELRNLTQKYKQAFILIHKLIITLNGCFQTKTQ